ncbi:MAG: hypothetical protein QM529_05325 [Hydrotalea sp.]|nr:hypothetical protein [Hydrotalea sp.]
MKKNKKTIACLLLAGIVGLASAQSAIAREQLPPGSEGKLLNTVCKGKKEDMQSMRDLINILTGRVGVKRVQLTRGNCYLVTGKAGGQRYMGLFDPYELDELFYIVKE